jgi:hypothetical protein
MPRARRGPNGPKSSTAGKSGTNKPTPHKKSGTSGMGHEKSMTGKGAGKYYGK